MKPSMLQIQIEVGSCTVPHLPYPNYSLTATLTPQLTASTAIKPAKSTAIDFATRLFLRTDQAQLDNHTQCRIELSGITDSGNRVQIAHGEATVRKEGKQMVNLLTEKGQSGIKAEIQFCVSAVESKEGKSINSRINNLRNQVSNKQSSSDARHPSAPKSTPKQQSTPQINILPAQASLPSLPHIHSQKSPCNEQLETSQTTKQSTQGQDSPTKKQQEQSQIALALQMKVDQLQQELKRITNKLQQTQNLLEDHKKQNQKLRQQNVELYEMLILEEERSSISCKHVSKMNSLIEQLGKEDGSCALIHEKDEIVLINQELEDEISKKKQVIEVLRKENEQMKAKILQLESSKNLPIVDNKKLPPPATNINVKNGELEKVKKANADLQKNVANANKKNEELQKQINKMKDHLKNKEKELELERKKVKKPQQELKEKAPVAKARDMKSPPLKQEVLPSPKVTKPKASNSKGEKPDQKLNVEEKRSHVSELGSLAMELDVIIQPEQLMLNSRNMDGSSLRQSRENSQPHF